MVIRSGIYRYADFMVFLRTRIEPSRLDQTVAFCRFLDRLTGWRTASSGLRLAWVRMPIAAATGITVAVVGKLETPLIVPLAGVVLRWERWILAQHLTALLQP